MFLGHGFGEEVPLHAVDPGCPDKFNLLLGFHSLGDHAFAQSFQYDTDEGDQFEVVGGVGDNAPVYLEDIERHVHQDLGVSHVKGCSIDDVTLGYTWKSVRYRTDS